MTSVFNPSSRRGTADKNLKHSQPTKDMNPRKGSAGAQSPDNPSRALYSTVVRGQEAMEGGALEEDSDATSPREGEIAIYPQEEPRNTTDSDGRPLVTHLTVKVFFMGDPVPNRCEIETLCFGKGYPASNIIQMLDDKDPALLLVSTALYRRRAKRGDGLYHYLERTRTVLDLSSVFLSVSYDDDQGRRVYQPEAAQEPHRIPIRPIEDGGGYELVCLVKLMGIYQRPYDHPRRGNYEPPNWDPDTGKKEATSEPVARLRDRLTGRRQ